MAQPLLALSMARSGLKKCRGKRRMKRLRLKEIGEQAATKLVTHQ